MNARPGLNIQIANGTGLLNRVMRIDALYSADALPAERAVIARREFALPGALVSEPASPALLPA
jgi:hypothetical protein